MGDLALKNRIFMAPMTRARGGPDCIANSTVAEYYAQRADAGLIISEGTHVSKMAIGWCNVPGVYKPEHAAAWKVRFFKVTAHPLFSLPCPCLCLCYHSACLLHAAQSCRACACASAADRR